MQKNYLNGVYKFAFIIAIAFLPQLIFLGSYINNDSLALFATAIIIYAWIIGIESKWNLKSCTILGIGLGICALSYYNAYGYALISFIFYIFTCVWNKIKIKEFLKKGLLIAMITLLISGWWFIRSAVLYNGDFLGLKTQDEYAEKYAKAEYKPSNRKTPQKDNISFLDMLTHKGWLELTYYSFVGVFGYMNVVLKHNIIYMIYIIIYLFGFVGTLIRFKDYFMYKNHTEEEKRKVTINYSFAFSIIIPIILSMYYSYTSDFQAQGRYIMPMLIPFYYFVITGIKNILDIIEILFRKSKLEKIKSIIMLFLIVGIFLICMYSLFFVNIPYYEDKFDLLNSYL